jgi:hypothetical protein
MMKITREFVGKPKKYDKNGQVIIEQGRVGDSKRILSPEIKIIGE